MPPRVPASRLSARVALLASALLLLLGVLPAVSSAEVKVLGTFAGPIQDTAICTAEPEDATMYGNSPLYPDSVDDLVAGGLRNEAGAHADYCIAYRLTPQMGTGTRPAATPEYPADPATHPFSGDDVQQVIVDTPVGFAAAASAIPTCSDADFGVGTDAFPACPNSKVGDVRIRLHMGTNAAQSAMNTLDGAVTGIYNLEAGPNEVARLGVSIDVGFDVPTKFLVRVVFAGGERNRLRSIVEDPPKTLIAYGGFFVQQLYVESVALRFFGTKTAHPAMVGDAFAETGTECGTPLSADFSFKTYGLPDSVTSAATSAPHTLTGCEALDFGASVDVETTQKAPAVPSETKLTLNVDQNPPTQHGTALMRDATVVLPDGLELGAQVGTRAGGLNLCAAAEFDANRQSAPGCAAGSRVGSVEIISPLVQNPLVGDVFLGEQHAVGELPDLYLAAAFAGSTAPDAPRIKLVGKTSVDAAGRVKTVFKNNPQLRFSKLTLTFDGGPSALLTTPRSCGTTTGSAEFAPWSGGTPATSQPPLTIDADCASPGFAPSVSIAASNPQAGASSPTQITIQRPDRSPWLDDIRVSLPSGFLADLHVPTECAAAAAATGNCPASSRIATVSVLAGTGEQPLPLTGQMFLTEREAGAVAGAVIVVRAKIGELDLGDVVVPGRINLRPTDAGLDFISDMPTRFLGLALQLRKIVVDIDRQGFALNPSACGPIGYSAVATGDGGQTANPSGAASYTGCGNLPFQPRLAAKLTGDVRPGGHPGMLVEVAARAGDSNLKATTVVLPAGVAADLKNVQSPCARADFEAGNCPASTKVGQAVANVAIAPEAIPGDIYLVRVPGETLPGLGLNFTGRFAQRVMSVVKIDKTGRLVTIFDAIPDLPLRRLTVDITSSPKGPLQLPPGECAANTRWDATFTGQGGQTAIDHTGLRCADKSKVRLSDRGGLTLRNFDFGGRNLQSAKVTLPAGWRFNTKRAKYGKHSWARTTGSSTRRKFTRRTMTVTTRGSKASTLRLKVYGTVISKRSKSKKAKTVSVRTRFTFRDGAVQTQTIKVKAR